MRLQVVLFLVAFLHVGIPARCADAVSVDFVGDNPGLILTSSQEWGQLGLNTAAHPAGQTAMPLQIAEKTYAKGLGCHARGEIVLALDKEYSLFEAEIGVQKQSGNCGSVIFRARADAVDIFKSTKIDGTMSAQPIRFSVEGVEELRLLVNDAGDGIACDLGNWADARLTRSVNAATGQNAAENSVNVAPFARTTTWDPSRSDGARANRTQEFRAEDLFTETELKPKRNGSYAVPTWTNGIGCIGLQWLNRRALRELVLQFPDAAQVPSPNSVKIEGWFGESAWQGNWRPLSYELRQDGNRLICKLDRKARAIQTRKIRWILPAAGRPQSIRLAAFTRSTWGTTDIFVQVENPKSGGRGKLTVDNGEIFPLPIIHNPHNQKSAITWSLGKPLQFRLRYSRPSHFKSDPTVLLFDLPSGKLGVGVEDVLANDCVYLPEHGLFVARILPLPAGEGRGQGERNELRDASSSPSPSPLVQGRGFSLPVTLAEYKQRIASKKTVLDEVRTMPDQTLAQAMEKTHHDAQKEGPVLLSLACDNIKYQLDRNGTLSCLVCPNPAQAKHTTRFTLRPTFGDGKSTNLTRGLDGEWLPIPLIEIADGGVIYRQRTFVAPADEPGDSPTRLNRRSVCVVEFTITNNLTEPAEASLALALTRPDKSAVELQPKSRGWQLFTGEEKLGFIATNNAALLTATAQDGTTKLKGTLPAHSGARCVAFLPTDRNISLGPFTAAQLRTATEAYWQAMLARSARVNTPDPLLNDIIRSSQVRCLIDARSEADGERVAAWIAAISYGPLESESHSPIRGMDLMGHEDFARRSLDFFIHRYNKEGFLTTGYTTFGTAWHLWTVGEHYRLYRDKAWLKQVASELARVCHWIVRQTEKTKKLDAHGKPVPEYGLMPPGVLADWNSFAYHFCMNAYYVAALREVGIALKDIGHPDARFFIKQSEELRKNTMRAYAWTQSRAPAMPLRDGTWIAHYPSQVHSPGNLGDFFPGQDAGRSWCYNVELGAHQLVPAGVLAPRSREVTQMMDHMEDVQFLADGWFDYPATMNHSDWFNNGGFSKVQPYYTRNGEIYAMQDEVKPFVRSYFNTIAAMLNPEVLTLWEHFHHSGAWDKTHETGYFLQQTRFMLAMEYGNELWLAPLITSNWLQDGAAVSAANVPTTFGKVSFRLSSHVKDGYIEAQVEAPIRSTPKALVLRLRHPERKPIRSVSVNGKPHTNFDPKRETITLPRGTKPLEVRAEF